MVMTGNSQVKAAPFCDKCRELTTLVSVEMVEEKPISVFQCSECDKLFAEAGAKSVAPGPRLHAV